MALSGIGGSLSSGVSAARSARLALKKKGSASTDSKTISEYVSHLTNKFKCVKNGDVTISAACIMRAAGDPEKAKELEQTLDYYTDSCRQGRRTAEANAEWRDAKLEKYSEAWSIDSNGNVTMKTNATVTRRNETKKYQDVKQMNMSDIKEKRLPHRIDVRI